MNFKPVHWFLCERPSSTNIRIKFIRRFDLAISGGVEDRAATATAEEETGLESAKISQFLFFRQQKQENPDQSEPYVIRCNRR